MGESYISFFTSEDRVDECFIEIKDKELLFGVFVKKWGTWWLCELHFFLVDILLRRAFQVVDGVEEAFIEECWEFFEFCEIWG